MVTGDATYNAAIRPRITLKTIDGADDLYTYNAFDDTHTLNITRCDVELAAGESGTFNITISDNQNLVGLENIHNVKTYIELGKKEEEFKHVMIGYGDVFSINRPISKHKEYVISGFGSAVWASQLLIHRRERYRKDESDAKIYNIVDNALTKRKWRPLKTQDRSIEDITGWSPDGISTAINTPYTVVNKPLVYFSDLMNELCDITGAVWYIDFEGGEETFTFTYDSGLQTPVVIKSGDLMNRQTDSGTKTSYIKSGFVVEDTTSTDAGTATRLITSTIQDKVNMFAQTENKGSTTLDFRAIAQQIIINNDARRIDSIVLKLSKIGEPTSPKDRINGDICLDNGSNQPKGLILDEIHVPLSSLKSNPEDIEVPVEISAKSLDVAQSKIWVRLFQRSGDGVDAEGNDTHDSGEPQHDPANTVRWHHNGQFATVQGQYSSQANEGDDNKISGLDWHTTNNGPTYCVTVKSNIRRLFARTNSTAAARIRLREQFIPTDFLDDPQDVIRYLSLNLSRTSKGRRGIGEFTVTVPNNFIFKPYQGVYFSDGLSEVTDTFKVQRVRYNMGSNQGDPQIGTLSCGLTLSGSYNSLLAGCSCL